jgi:hypothetical protein
MPTPTIILQQTNCVSTLVQARAPSNHECLRDAGVLRYTLICKDYGNQQIRRALDPPKWVAPPRRRPHRSSFHLSARRISWMTPRHIIMSVDPNRCRILAFFGPWRTTWDWRLRGVNHVLIRWSDLHRTDWPFHLNHGQGETPAHSSWPSRYTGSGRTQHKPGPLYLRHQHSIQRIQINGPNDQGGYLVPASSEQL